MKALTTKVIFDRKNISDNTRTKGLVQIEVIFNRKQMFISTGIKLYRNQWDKRTMKIRQSLYSDEYNKTIDSLLARIREYHSICIANHSTFSFDGLKSALNDKNDDDFLLFCENRIKDRGDLRASSKKSQLSGLKTLQDFGKIKRFSDITLENIVFFDDYLHDQRLMQTTIWGKHKVLKTYINEALKFDKIKDNPYRKFKVDRGESRQNRYVEESDIRKLIACKKMPEYLKRIRDIVVVQFYTGLSVSDLIALDTSTIEEIDGQKVIIGKRNKTGITYTIVIFKEIQNIIAKYDGRLPYISPQKYNEYMKLCFLYAKIDLPDVSSHWLRRGFGMWALNNGVPMEIVSKALGHSSISITEKLYAKVKSKTVVEAMTKIKQ